ncbi:MAG TPA: 3-oxoacyl-[acyl-carrier-protein] synthase III C-terminal domain-containing protein [Holophagaceae bacterium]|nr:3-oxoacyl-[acyl-carrier-protein] synthase III C-terminal domain-containing protein [Holophagaceae bacterium]
MALRTLIVGSGSHLPSEVVPNGWFLNHDFRTADGQPVGKANAEILEQFEAITGIHERRYAPAHQVTSDLALAAATEALASSGLDGESLDGLIVAHNFGDVRVGTHRTDMVPALAARVKAGLGIRNPASFAFDLIFGCPGWVQGVIQADCMIRSGDARRLMVIGADTLSRISDPHDRDSLIYADGAGAVILEAVENDGTEGILAHAVRSDCRDYSHMLTMGPSNLPGSEPGELFLKMEGRKLYKYALNHVAGAMKACLDKAGAGLGEVTKILIHQANWKMDEAIVDALYELAGLPGPPAGMMPMTIGWLGNSSVATVPTLLDLIRKGRMEGQALHPGDLLLFASVGAGMNVNAVVYRVPAKS